MSDSIPSPSALIYLFADRLQPPAPDEGALARVLLAVAAWSLREEGTIDLAPLAHPRPVDGRLGFTRRRAYVEQPGLGGGDLSALQSPFSELRSRWAHFEAREADLHSALMSDCAAGLGRPGH